MDRQAIKLELEALQELKRLYDYEELCSYDDLVMEIHEELNVDLMIEVLMLVLRAYEDDHIHSR